MTKLFLYQIILAIFKDNNIILFLVEDSYRKIVTIDEEMYVLDILVNSTLLFPSCSSPFSFPHIPPPSSSSLSLTSPLSLLYPLPPAFPHTFPLSFSILFKHFPIIPSLSSFSHSLPLPSSILFLFLFPTSCPPFLVSLISCTYTRHCRSRYANLLKLSTDINIFSPLFLYLFFFLFPFRLEDFSAVRQHCIRNFSNLNFFYFFLFLLSYNLFYLILLYFFL